MIRGAMVFLILFFGTVPIFLLFMLFGLPIMLLPAPGRIALRGPLVACGRLWICFSTSVLRLSGIPIPECDGNAALADDGQYLLLCNHRSWTDIMVLLQLFGPRMPFPRFIAKREMLWVPLIGLAIWMLDFPLVRRSAKRAGVERSERDREEVARGCRRLGSGPFTLVIFPEGTRFTPGKRQHQQSPYRHLLMPRSGGLGVALEHLGQRLDEVVNVTIGYDAPQLSYWDYLCGRSGRVRVQIERFPVPQRLLGLEGEVGRQVLQEWLRGVWSEKEKCLQGWCDQSGGKPL